MLCFDLFTLLLTNAVWDDSQIGRFNYNVLVSKSEAMFTVTGDVQWKLRYLGFYNERKDSKVCRLQIKEKL